MDAVLRAAYVFSVPEPNPAPLAASCHQHLVQISSVADPGCFSHIPEPDFYPSRIPDPKTATQDRSEKKISCHTFFCSQKFHKIVNYFIFEMLKKKMWANFLRIICRTFYPKYCHQVLKNMGLGSGIRDPERTYSGSRIQGSKRHRIPGPQHCR
jgi:hypothetical protein